MSSSTIKDRCSQPDVKRLANSDCENGDKASGLKAVNDEGPVSATDGYYFSYFLVTVCLFSWLSGLVHLIGYLKVSHWGRNPADYLLGNSEPPEESSANETLIHVHAVGGLIIILLVTFQVGFTLLFRSKNEVAQERSRRMHGILGRFFVAVWCTVSLLGMIYTLTADRWENTLVSKLYLTSLFWFTGLGSLTNLAIGLKVLYSKPKTQRSKKDYLVHKGCMSFSMYWTLFSAFNEVLTSVIQVIFRDCSIGTVGILACQFQGLLIQVVVIVTTMAKFDPALLKEPFVRWNLGLLMCYCGLLLLGAIMSGFNPKEGTCLNPY